MRLLCAGGQPTADLVRDSYDRLAGGYDEAWTDHMRDLSMAMLDRLAVPRGARCLDLTCGTGFLTGQLAARAGTRALGVDASAGMLAVAAARDGGRCDFRQADVLAFLNACPPARFDVVTCAWGLGYSRPARVLAGVARVLAPGGRMGVIDNSLFSLAGVLGCALRAFAERPEALAHAMNVRFLPGSVALSTLMRWHGLGVSAAWDGARTYRVSDGPAAVARLQATGAAAGFEFAATAADRDAVFARFAEILQARCAAPGGIPITHRYLAAVGVKR
ncbi:MAG: methyltransferase domain-containing protein [Planctomycetota bacterium]|nr:methyltransferase domain-containing protein [Planctomycetota bacterium]